MDEILIGEATTQERALAGLLVKLGATRIEISQFYKDRGGHKAGERVMYAAMNGRLCTIPLPTRPAVSQ